jgi:peptidoglycan/xylan/chitin deacetylase (PgdA/CDA1 family)
MHDPHDPTPRHALYRSLWARLHPLDDDARDAAIGALRAWAEDSGRARDSHRPLSRAETRMLAADGLVEVGSHTRSHANLPALSPDRQREEIRQGKNELEMLIGRPVQHFAYPHGLYQAATPGRVREAGFRSACTTWPSPVWRGSDAYRLPRIAVEDWDGHEFARRLRTWMKEV